VKVQASEILVREMAFDGTEVQLSRMGKKINAHRYFVGKNEGKRLLGVGDRIILKLVLHYSRTASVV